MIGQSYRQQALFCSSAEYYKRRIIFWLDEDREFEDRLEDIQLDNAKLLALTGTNNFDAKKLLAMDDTVSNYLVYDPVSYERQDDNWLLNVQLYAEEFRADLNSIWMDEIGLPQTPALRKQVKSYRKFMSAKDRRVKIAALAANINSAGQLSLAVMAVLPGPGCKTQQHSPRGDLCRTEQDKTPSNQGFVTYGSKYPSGYVAQ